MLTTGPEAQSETCIWRNLETAVLNARGGLIVLTRCLVHPAQEQFARRFECRSECTGLVDTQHPPGHFAQAIGIVLNSLAKFYAFRGYLSADGQPTIFESGPRRVNGLWSVAPRQRQPVALVAEPRVVQHRSFAPGESRRGNQRPVGVATPFAQKVHRVPAREDGVVGYGQSEVAGAKWSTVER